MFQFCLPFGTAAIILCATFVVAYRQIATSPDLDISCLEVGSIATAQWINAAGQSCTWTGLVGSNFGIHPAKGRENMSMTILCLFFRILC